VPGVTSGKAASAILAIEAKGESSTTRAPAPREDVKRFRGGLVFKAHRLLYHTSLGLRVIKKKKKERRGGYTVSSRGHFDRGATPDRLPHQHHLFAQHISGQATPPLSSEYYIRQSSTYKTVKAHIRQSRHIQDSHGQILAMAFKAPLPTDCPISIACSRCTYQDTTSEHRTYKTVKATYKTVKAYIRQ